MKALILSKLWRFRLASSEDSAFVLEAYRLASEQFKSKGIDQWQDNYPNLNSFLKDLSENKSYVLEVFEDGQYHFVGSLYLSFDTDSTYTGENSSVWQYNMPYAVIHRIVISTSYLGCGYGRIMFYFAALLASKRDIFSFRLDTHEDNYIMRQLLTQLQFANKGKIRFKRSEEDALIERIAYEVETSILSQQLYKDLFER